MADYYIGLISGTSIDAIDAVLVDFQPQPRLLARHSHPLSEALRERLYRLQSPAADELREVMQLDVQLGELFADAARDLLSQAGVEAGAVRAIGSHGQTVRHYPDGASPATLQIADPNIIAERTGITTVADFRRRDLAAGGQGAPLVPAFHARLLEPALRPAAVVNLGGIANLTCLPAGQDGDAAVTGFDTGPANGLLDAWYRRHHAGNFDPQGRWAASGTVQHDLLRQLLDDPYFTRPPPKSTGREYFNLEWLQQHLERHTGLSTVDVQATLCELSAVSLAQALSRHTTGVRKVYCCGGGVHNQTLMQRLAALLPEYRIQTTAVLGVDPDWMEAMAFAWLAQQTLAGQPGNLPAVTGARHRVILGGVYTGARG